LLFYVDIGSKKKLNGSAEIKSSENSNEIEVLGKLLIFLLTIFF